MALRAGENEAGVVAELDVTPKKGFNALFGKGTHLLEFVYGDDGNCFA